MLSPRSGWSPPCSLPCSPCSWCRRPPPTSDQWRTTPPTRHRRSARQKAKPGTIVLGHWLVDTYGGGFGPISRSCAGSSVSEHKEGRAFDWTLDAARAVDRERAQTFLDAGLRHRRRGQRARAGPSDGHHVHHLERPHVRVVPTVRAEGLPQLELPDPQGLLQDAAPPRPHAHLAEPRRWQRPHQLVRRSAPRQAPREPTPPASRPPRSPCATADRCRSRTAGSAVRCASAPGCARTSRLCGRR